MSGSRTAKKRPTSGSGSTLHKTNTQYAIRTDIEHAQGQSGDDLTRTPLDAAVRVVGLDDLDVAMFLWIADMSGMLYFVKAGRLDVFTAAVGGGRVFRCWNVADAGHFEVAVTVVVVVVVGTHHVFPWAMPTGFLSAGHCGEPSCFALSSLTPDRIFRVSGEESVEEEQRGGEGGGERTTSYGICQWYCPVNSLPASLPRTAVQIRLCKKVSLATGLAVVVDAATAIQNSTNEVRALADLSPPTRLRVTPSNTGAA